jgi:uncharacterized membrane protein HdeD (DUF308 family)/pimeloyl-ACP methyl ester carboxylesterase
MSGSSILDRFTSRVPPWAVIVLSLICVSLGASLTFRPFRSVEVLVLFVGVIAIITGALLLVSPDERPGAYRRLLGVAWILLGSAVLVWPNLSVEALAILVGVALIVNGALDLIRAVTGRLDEPVADFIGGAASCICGVLALAWPDLTIFVVAVLFGARTVLFGLTQLVSGIQLWRNAGQVPPAPAPASRGRLRLGLKVVTRIGALILAVALLALSVTFRSEFDEVSAFYDTPDEIPDTPGVLLRTESLDRELPEGAEGWLILYSTTSSLGEPAVGSAFVLASTDRSSEPRPAVLWTHGTAGIERQCAPSMFDDVTSGIPAVPELLDNGWVLVAPDYIGMGTEGDTPFLVGTGQAHSSLDALRAAYQLSDVSLAEQAVVWGHSQGGNAALWTGLLAEDYAPELVIEGVSAIAPVTDVVSLVQSIEQSAGGSVLISLGLTAYSNTYDDVSFDDNVRPGARAMVREAAQRCVPSSSLLASVIAGSGGESILATDVASSQFGDRLRENSPSADMRFPLLVAGGDADEIISIEITESWVADQCAAGHDLDFRVYPGSTHLSVLEEPSAMPGELIAWTEDRFAGVSAASTC